MQQVEVIRPRQAAIEANAYETTVYWAIAKGYLQVRRERGRVFILRDSFEAWRKRLEAKRKLRQEEVEARSGV
jgi:hypothetical protein